MFSILPTLLTNPLAMSGSNALVDMCKQYLSQAFVSTFASGLGVPISIGQSNSFLGNDATFGFLNNSTGEFTKLPDLVQLNPYKKIY